MNLKILVPFAIFAEKTGVSRIVAETQRGSFGLLPHRLDCVAALTPGILTYEIGTEGDVYVAVDDGVLVKTGADVLVSVRRAFSGADLQRLRLAVEQNFVKLGDRDKRMRSVMAKLEAGLLHRLVAFRHE
ncbi:MAG: F0F1 ATP synthase subunit epsilon [Polyangiaceae bacterium]